MNEYTASNGITVKDHQNGQGVAIYNDSVPVLEYISCLMPTHMEALREFFQAEADERLKRWRDPEQTEFIVYGPYEPDEIGYNLIVTNERTGESKQYLRSDDEGDGSSFEHPWSNKHAWAARHWVAAHPESKPWHDAKPGEVWMLVTTRHDEARAYGVEEEPGGMAFCPAFRADFKSLDVDGAGVKSAHRIYPEAD